MGSFVDSIDEAVNESAVGRFFELKERGRKLSIEFRGALATFMSMAYILAVNPRIISDSGGPCPFPESGDLFDPAFSACIEDVKKELITATALASMFGCFVMGLGANLPVALAPGMGMNGATVRDKWRMHQTLPKPFACFMINVQPFSIFHV